MTVLESLTLLHHGYMDVVGGGGGGKGGGRPGEQGAGGVRETGE